MKAYEDMLLYDEISNWQPFANYFDTILPEEKTFSIPDETILTWHHIIKSSIIKKPDDHLIVESLGSKLQSENDNEIRKLLHELKQNTKINQLVASFYKDFQISHI